MERKKVWVPLWATLAIIILQLSYLTKADSLERDPLSVNYYSCGSDPRLAGDGSESDAKTYATQEDALICLFFEDGVNPPRKMVFNT